MGRIVISDILRGIKSVDEVNLSLVDNEEKNILECVSIQMCGWFSGMCAHVCVCVCVCLKGRTDSHLPSLSLCWLDLRIKWT